jgi:RNAse (barnase) inhibitor barstar
MGQFVFINNISELNENLYEKIINIRKKIKNKRELFNLFSTTLDFPSYFGKNWDALYDCLCDLNWITEKSLLMMHQDVPFKSSKEQETYLKLLLDVVNHWEKIKVIKFCVAFPYDCKDNVEKVLLDANEEM